MAGKVSLPLTVEIAFGAGPMDPDPLTWTDVSAYVMRSRTISLSRGRDPQTGEPDSGPGAIRFKNPDGRFTLGKTGAFGLVRNRLPIRVRRGATVLWTGLVEKWGQATDAGVRSTVDATLVNRWPRLKVRSLTGDRLLQVCQTLAPDYLWPLTDPAGSTRAAPDSGLWSLMPVAGYPPPTFGGGANPQGSDRLACLSSPGATPAYLRQWWDGPGAVSPGIFLTGGPSVSVWVKCPNTSAGAAVHADIWPWASGGYKVDVEQTHVDLSGGWGMMGPGTDTWTDHAAPSGWRHVVVTAQRVGSTVTLIVYSDTVPVITRSWSSPGWAAARDMALWVHDGAEAAYLSVFDRTLTSTEVAAIHAAGRDALGATGDTADVRAATAAQMWSPTTVDIAGTYTATLSKQAVEGVSQADLLLACAQAEDGLLYVSRDGWPVLRPRGHRTEAALAATIPAQVLSHDATWELDDTLVVNAVQVDRMALGEVASTVNRRNEASIALYDEATKSLQLWLDSDAAAVDRANGEVQMWAESTPRSRQFSVDLATCGAAISVDTLLAVDIGSRIQVSGLGSVYPAGTSAGYYVDAIADEITEKSWRRTFTVTPALDFLVLDDATFGGLDDWPLG